MGLKQEFLEQCLRCPTENGEQIRRVITQTGQEIFDDAEITPSGRPILCCRVHVVSAINRDYGTPPGQGIATVNSYMPPPATGQRR
jgi:hypothetical protein